MSTTIKVDHICAIEHLEFKLPKGGGVMVARGTHGTGKSTLVKAIGARLGGDTAGLEPADGRKKGELSIEHNGAVAKLTVRASGKRNTGTLEVSSLEGRFDISALIDPQIKDPEACELARVKALVSLIGNVTLTPNDLFAAVNVPDATEVPGVFFDDDAIAIVTTAKREMEKLARYYEKLRDQQQRTVATLKESLDAEPSSADAMPIDDAKKALETIISSEAGDRIRHDVWEKQRAVIEQAKAVLATIPESGNIDDLRAKYEAAKLQAKETERLVSELQTRHAVEREQYLALREVWARERDLQTKRRQVLDAIQPLENEPALPDYTMMKSAAHHTIDEAKRAMTVRGMEEQLKGERTTYKEQVRLADAWRTSAKSCWSELFSRLPSGIGMRVFGDELVVITDRSDFEPYRELSTGERAFLAIEIAVAATQPPALLTIRQELWDGLSNATKQAVADRARKHGCWILTAEIGDGPLIVRELEE